MILRNKTAVNPTTLYLFKDLLSFDKMDIEEQFKEFPYSQYKNIYKVSNLGKIINIKNGNIKKTNILKGYDCIRINNETFRVDILVAKCFIGESDLFLTHIDNNNRNNLSSNLLYKNLSEHLKTIYGNEWKKIIKIMFPIKEIFGLYFLKSF